MRYIIKNAWNECSSEFLNVLVDSKTGKEIFSDGMEPEDAVLTRDLSVLVDELNSLAEQLENCERALG